MLQVNQKQPWSITVRAKPSNFYLRLKMSKLSPLCKISRFSVRFKLHPFHFRIKSEPHSSFSWKPKSLKRRIFQIFRPNRTSRDDIVGTWCVSKCGIGRDKCLSSVQINVALGAQISGCWIGG
ncbi:hypothetical protein F511_22805 [Dorcoceras hygrometricum]|uniref:Uncharacterized protein n=1 Tax=Dorcoceras hygrometricum TaxID=472368 RepID=A0A2Z7C1U1_9LAMI|nr:hypothetical protein F511_22805 [Dorcoceras hygrometricum]